MSGQRSLRTTAIAALVLSPLALAAAIAGALALLGEGRMLQLTLLLPAGFLLVGGAVSLTLAAWFFVRHRKRAQLIALDLARAEGKRHAVDRERDQHRRFLARLDHELKNPLTAIRATAGAAGDGSAPWRVVDEQARKLSDLVRDLRKLAELETRTLERETVDLEELLEDALAAVRQQDPAAGSRLSLTVTRVPWPVPDAGPIEVRLREQQGWAVIEVADLGRGIPSADLAVVFDELARASNARDVGGSGLGLTLVSTVMQRHGGQAQLRSVEGAGTVAELRLPTRPTDMR